MALQRGERVTVGRIRSMWIVEGLRRGDDHPFSRFSWTRREAEADLTRYRDSGTEFVYLQLVEKHRDETETVVWHQP